jgi:Txe/YoeB family toxin of toxin-antitoxin system
MQLLFTESAWEDYLWFQERDRRLLKRINLLIKDTMRSPFDGIGKLKPFALIYPATGRAASMMNIVSSID